NGSWHAVPAMRLAARHAAGKPMVVDGVTTGPGGTVGHVEPPAHTAVPPRPPTKAEVVPPPPPRWPIGGEAGALAPRTNCDRRLTTCGLLHMQPTTASYPQGCG